MASSILQQLKEHTRQNHEKLEQSQLLCYLTSKSITEEIYLKILLKFYGYFAPLEEELNRFSEIPTYLPDFTSRRKAAWLLRDLSQLDQAKEVEYCSDLPSISSASEAFGCLYVMEGSTLGGRLIYKNIESLLNLDKQNGASFFYGYGQETGEKWKGFQKGISSFVNIHEQQTINAANQTFEKLKAWINN